MRKSTTDVCADPLQRHNRSSPRCSAERSFRKRAERTLFTAGGVPRARTRATPGCRPHEQAPVHTTHTHTHKRTRISFISTSPISRPHPAHACFPHIFPSSDHGHVPPQSHKTTPAPVTMHSPAPSHPLLATWHADYLSHSQCPAPRHSAMECPLHRPLALAHETPPGFSATSRAKKRPAFAADSAVRRVRAHVCPAYRQTRHSWGQRVGRCRVGAAKPHLHVPDDGAVLIVQEFNADLGHGSPRASAPEHQLNPSQFRTRITELILQSCTKSVRRPHTRTNPPHTQVAAL